MSWNRFSLDNQRDWAFRRIEECQKAYSFDDMTMDPSLRLWNFYRRQERNHMIMEQAARIRAHVANSRQV